jgi:hypothetical protein
MTRMRQLSLPHARDQRRRQNGFVSLTRHTDVSKMTRLCHAAHSPLGHRDTREI